MLNQPSPRTIYIIISLVIIILAPIIVLIFPLFSVETFHFDKGQIVRIPLVENFYLVAIAFITLIIGVLTLAFKRNSITYILSGVLCVMFFGLIYVSTIGYTIIHKDYIVLQNIAMSEKYEWNDISDVLYEYEVGEFGIYYFLTKDGREFSIAENGKFGRDETREIAHIINLKKINFEKRQIE